MPPTAIERMRLDIRLPVDPIKAQLLPIAELVNPTERSPTAAAKHVLLDALEARELLALAPAEQLHALAQRLRETLAVDRRHLRELLDGEEIASLCAILNGTILDPWQYGSLASEARDADLPAGLVSKLRGLSPGAELALVTAIERWWRLPREQRPEPARLLEY